MRDALHRAQYKEIGDSCFPLLSLTSRLRQSNFTSQRLLLLLHLGELRGLEEGEERAVGGEGSGRRRILTLDDSDLEELDKSVRAAAASGENPLLVPLPPLHGSCFIAWRALTEGGRDELATSCGAAGQETVRGGEGATRERCLTREQDGRKIRARILREEQENQSHLGLLSPAVTRD
eukprot:764690-Hanusia_phi.AAC.4